MERNSFEGSVEQVPELKPRADRSTITPNDETGLEESFVYGFYYLASSEKVNYSLERMRGNLIETWN